MTERSRRGPSIAMPPPRDDTGDLEVQLRELAGVPTAAVRVVVAWADLDMGALFGRHLPAVAGRLAELGVAWAGAPYGRYHEWGPERVDVEMGIPVEAIPKALPALAEVEPGEVGWSALPGGRAAVAVHRGSYAGLSATWERLRGWLRRRDAAIAPGPWESYVDTPDEGAMDEVRTELVAPLA